MAVTGTYYRILSSKSDDIDGNLVRGPYNASDLTNLKRKNDNSEFIVNTTEVLDPSVYEQKFASQDVALTYIADTTDWVDSIQTAENTDDARSINLFKSVTVGSDGKNFIKCWYRKQAGWYNTAEPATRATNGQDLGAWNDQSTLGAATNDTGSQEFTVDLETGGIAPCLVAADASNQILSTPQITLANNCFLVARLRVTTFSSGANDIAFYDASTANNFIRFQGTAGEEIRMKWGGSTAVSLLQI